MALDHDGETAEVQGSGSKPYQLKNTGGVLSCSCPAWRNQSLAIDKRTCKHLKQLRGASVEAARVGGSAPAVKTVAPAYPPAPRDPEVLWPAMPAAEEAVRIGHLLSEIAGKDVSVEPWASLRDELEWRRSDSKIVERAARAGMGPMASGVRASAAGSVAAGRHASGEKLRQDEKAKLFGPPVLLAESVEDHPDLDPAGWWLSEKLDGVRAYWDGTDFVSRQGNVFKAPAWFKERLPDHPLDGELWMGRGMFQQTISVVKSVDSGERWRKVTYVVFDHPSHPGAFEERMASLEELHARENPPFMRVHSHVKVLHRDQLAKELEHVASQGGEGLMIRQPGSKYETRRSSTLLKVKPFRDAEAVVVAHVPGKGRHKGRLGGLEVRMPDGKTFNVGTGLSDEERRNPPPVGATITYRYADKTDGGLPKCASFVAVRDYE